MQQVRGGRLCRGAAFEMRTNCDLTMDDGCSGTVIQPAPHDAPLAKAASHVIDHFSSDFASSTPADSADSQEQATPRSITLADTAPACPAAQCVAPVPMRSRSCGRTLVTPSDYEQKVPQQQATSARPSWTSRLPRGRLADDDTVDESRIRAAAMSACSSRHEERCMRFDRPLLGPGGLCALLMQPGHAAAERVRSAKARRRQAHPVARGSGFRRRPCVADADARGFCTVVTD